MHQWFYPAMFPTMLGQPSLFCPVTLLLKPSPQSLLLTEANFAFPAWCRFNLTQLVLAWMSAVLGAVFQGKAARLTRLVSWEAVVWPLSFDVSYQMSVQPQTSKGQVENTFRHQRLSSAGVYMHQNPLPTDERAAKLSETRGIEHICQKHLWEKHS